VIVQVYLMDKRFLDPRRPHKAPKAMTPAEQEERLIPYSPLLPLAPNLFATYNRAVARLQGGTIRIVQMESAGEEVVPGALAGALATMKVLWG
jgi:ER membrane protein complex subunit 1, C-terminal